MFSSFVRRMRGLGLLFHACVTLPTLCALLYFGLIASDVYISESRVVIRSPEKQGTAGLGLLLRSTGFGSTGDEIYAVRDYALSRDALKLLNVNDGVAKAYSRDSIDTFSRFGAWWSNTSFESLYKYFRNKLSIEHETSSSITTIQVRAYTARDAQWINQRLVEQAERLVNRLNERGRGDLINYAQNEVDNAEQAASNAALALSAYRNRTGLIDPERQATVQLGLISRLQEELIATKSQLLQLRSFTPDNPQVPVLQTRVRGLNAEIEDALGKIAGDRGSLAGAAARYQRLALESQFADRQLASALASLEEARNEARRKQVYLERIVQPNLPDYPLEPRRLRGILATLVLGLVAWGILSMLLAGVREHQE